MKSYLGSHWTFHSSLSSLLWFHCSIARQSGSQNNRHCVGEKERAEFHRNRGDKQTDALKHNISWRKLKRLLGKSYCTVHPIMAYTMHLMKSLNGLKGPWYRANLDRINTNGRFLDFASTEDKCALIVEVECKPLSSWLQTDYILDICWQPTSPHLTVILYDPFAPQ